MGVYRGMCLAAACCVGVMTCSNAAVMCFNLSSTERGKHM